MTAEHTSPDGSRPGPSFQQDFTFISENSSLKDKKIIRLHVARDNLNKRRLWGERNKESKIPVGWRRLDSENAQPGPTRESSLDLKHVDEATRPRHSRTVPERRPSPFGSHSNDSLALSAAEGGDGPGPRMNRSSPLGDVDRHLVSVDPFMNLAVKAKQHTQILLNFGMCRLSGLMLLEYGPFVDEVYTGSSVGWKENPLPKEWTEGIGLPVTLAYEPSFHNLLSWTSAQVDARQGRQVSPRTLYYYNVSLKALESLIDDPATRWSESVLVGTASLISSEMLTPSPRNCAAHAQALSNIIRYRKRAGFRTQSEVDRFMSFTSIYAVDGMTSHLPGLSKTGAISDELFDWQGDCNLFIQALEELNAWPVELNLFDDSSNEKLAPSFSLEIVHALAAPQSGIHEACQTYALCYLAIALCHRRDSPREQCLFVGGLNSSFRKLDDRSVASLAWLLVKENVNEAEHTERALQMLKVLWRLQAASKSLVKGFLRSFLDGHGRQPLRLAEAAMAHIKNDVLSEAYGTVSRSYST
jgi:hypothetical protein